jgi:HK97 family phage prohead protease
MERITKFMDEIVIEKAAGEDRTYWFTISTEDRDRDGDVIVQDSMKFNHFKKNPVILWGHDYRSTPIGNGIEWKTENGKTKMKIRFIPSGIDPQADRVERLVDLGVLKTVSIGFIPFKREPLNDEDKKMRPDMAWGSRLHAELLEVSVVSVPSNPNAAREMAKSYGFEVLEAGPRELKSPLLPYLAADGAVNPRLLKASFGALLGARSGVPIPPHEREAAFNHLARVAKEAGIDAPEFKDHTPDELRAAFAEVWDDELLDVVDAGLDQEEQVPAKSYLFKGSHREAIRATRDHLSRLLDATEETAPAEKSDALADALRGLTDVVAKIG